MKVLNAAVEAAVTAAMTTTKSGSVSSAVVNAAVNAAIAASQLVEAPPPVNPLPPRVQQQTLTFTSAEATNISENATNLDMSDYEDFTTTVNAPQMQNSDTLQNSNIVENSPPMMNGGGNSGINVQTSRQPVLVVPLNMTSNSGPAEYLQSPAPGAPPTFAVDTSRSIQPTSGRSRGSRSTSPSSNSGERVNVTKLGSSTPDSSITPATRVTVVKGS
jgi:hypothetical protein